MERIKTHLDGMFKELPRNGAAERIKAEMLENLQERYEELLAQTGSAEEAERQVIAEIGTAEEIREAILLASPKQRRIFTVMEIIALALSVGFVIFESATHAYFARSFNLWPRLIRVYYVQPLFYFTGAWVGAKALDYFMRPKGFAIQNKRLRRAFFIASIAVLSLFGAIMLVDLLNHIFSIGNFIPLQLYFLFWQNSYLFAITSVFLYLGKKR